MWAIMREFNVLPTDKRFLDLTSMQVEFILESMGIDNQIAQGKNPRDFISDDSFSYEEGSDFELPSDEEQADVWEQLQSMRPDNLKEQLSDRMNALSDEDGEPNLMLEGFKAERERRLRALGLVDEPDPLSDDDENIDTL